MDVQPILSLPCPTCGTDLTFLEQYQRHFCYQCQQYAPEGYGANGARTCPTCAGILAYVATYDRYFCYRCQQYAPDPMRGTPSQAVDVRSATAIAPVTSAEEASGEGAPAEPPESEPVPDRDEPESGEPAGEEEELIVVERPPLSREVIETAKKSMLLDLCKAYGLDAGGTKEQLRERLLSYFEEEAAAAAAVETESAEETPEGPTPPAEAEAPEEGSEPVAQELVTEPEPVEEAAPVPEEPGETTRPSDLARPRTIEAAAAAPSSITSPGIVREAPAIVPEARAPASMAAAVAHPCPQCGRELDYIAQYDRWYCHSCKTYAPKRGFKHACPTCGTTLRWIERYERWWCDAEGKYAPSDLPSPPSGSSAMIAAAAPSLESTAQPAMSAAIQIHRHRSPGAAIGIAAFGFVLWLGYQLVIALPAAFAIPPIATVPPDVAYVIQFLGLFLLGAGVLAGLAAVRDRR